MTTPYRDNPSLSQGNYGGTAPYEIPNDIPLVGNRGGPARPYADNDVPYSGQWMEKPPSSGKRKWFIIGGVFVVVAIIVAVVAGVLVSKNKNKKSSSTSSSSSNSNGNSAVSQSDPNDPSTFVKNSSYVHSLYGLAYTPTGSQLPDCGNSLADVITDIQIISQLTSRIRLYGADCNQTALVLEAIKQTKVNVTVFLGNYAVPNDNNTAYNRQRDTLKEAIQTYGTDHIAGMTVGNEFMLNYVTENNAANANDDIANTGADILLANIADTRSMLSGLSLSKTIPVGTSDAGDFFNNKILAAVDYGLANVHPWFANTTAAQGAGWTYDFFTNTDVAQAALLPNNPTFYIAETGWPSASSDAANAQNGPSGSPASIASLQTFLDDFVCASNTNGTKYFYFEFADEPWKDAQFGGVEGWWGLFNNDRTMKAITLPSCILD